MGRPRKWASDAERMAAKRALEATQGPGREPVLEPDPEQGTTGIVEEVVPGATELIDWEGKQWPVLRRPPISEAEYVAAEIQITRDSIARGLKDHDGERVKRSGEYARFRYRGYLVGEIASL